jgi:hypothetical protein
MGWYDGESLEQRRRKHLKGNYTFLLKGPENIPLDHANLSKMIMLINQITHLISLSSKVLHMAK